MAYREVTMVEVKEVLRQWLGGEPKKRVALLRRRTFWICRDASASSRARH
jgi:hypothetical protein